MGKPRFDIGLRASRLKKLKKEKVEMSNEIVKAKKELENLNSQLESLKRREVLHLMRWFTCREPTQLKQENSDKADLSFHVAKTRRRKTLQLGRIIHSTTSRTSQQQNRDARAGLWLTLANCKSNKELSSYIRSSSRVSNDILPGIINKKVMAYEKSLENTVRSVNVFYSGGIMTRRKYEKMTKVSSNVYKVSGKAKIKKRLTKYRQTFGEHFFLPGYVEYKKLVNFINSHDTGTLHPVPQAQSGAFSDPAEESNGLLDPVSGGCKDLENYLIDLANLYLSLEEAGVLTLKWFGKDRGAFRVAIGSDGALFGKHNEATSWLISFLNIADRVASCDDNFIILGANCKEDHPHMKQYAVQLSKQIPAIESKSYTIRGIDCSFHFELTPSDLKWISTFSGELNNAATYPCPFGNVSNNDLSKIDGSLGLSENDTWHPWAYGQRNKDAKSVQNKKEQHKSKKGKPLSRPVITKHIAQLKSRQEFVPLLGPLVQKAKCEPLHLANNNWQLWFHELFCIVLKCTSIPAAIKDINMLDPDCCLRKCISALKYKVKANKLCIKIHRWFKERGQTEFKCRFTEEESRKLCAKFMDLIVAVSPSCSGSVRHKLLLHALIVSGINLRDATSLFSRVTDIDQLGIDKLKKDCSNYFRTVKLFFRVTLSVWIVGYCVPLHSQQLFDEFGCGLGLNTMQGREAKHLQIKEYAEHATYKNRWEKVFQHEYMQLVWLRRKYPHSDCYTKGKQEYIPKDVLEHPDTTCYCGLPKLECIFCTSDMMEVIQSCVTNGELTQRAKQMFNQ